eukprot:1050539-Alexandrium_andersonii.AAC.1
MCIRDRSSWVSGRASGKPLRAERGSQSAPPRRSLRGDILTTPGRPRPEGRGGPRRGWKGHGQGCPAPSCPATAGTPRRAPSVSSH